MTESKKVGLIKEEVPSEERKPTQSQSSNKMVLLAKSKDQSWEDFKKLCVQKLREAGLLKDKPK